MCLCVSIALTLQLTQLLLHQMPVTEDQATVANIYAHNIKTDPRWWLCSSQGYGLGLNA